MLLHWHIRHLLRSAFYFLFSYAEFKCDKNKSLLVSCVNTVYRIMVEIYFGKRRKRGTASSNERMNKDPPRAYWPGLENENEADSNPIHEKNTLLWI